MTVDYDKRIMGDEVSHPVATCKQHIEDNVTDVLGKLAKEIGLELDHIKPEDVVSCHRRAVTDLLEILTAFIAYCASEDSVHFNNTESFDTNEPKISSKSDWTLTPHLATSPELPRSVGRPCPSIPLPAFEDSARPNSNLTALHKTGYFGATGGGGGGGGAVASKSLSALPRHGSHRHHHHPSIRSMQVPLSPPTTPKEMDELVEIAGSQSPTTLPPSLQSSPIETAAHPVGTQKPHVLEKRFHQDAMQSTSEAQSENVTVLAVSRMTTKSSHSRTGQYHHHHHYNRIPRVRKASSSSSGRGHSPTQTLTAPVDVSISSSPSSLLEDVPSSSALPMERALEVHTSTVDDPLQADSKPDEPRRYRRRRHRHMVSKDLCETVSCSSTTVGTEDILAWPMTDGKNVPSTLNASSSVYSHDNIGCPDDDLQPCPSALVLMARTEGFTKALSRRREYLRTIFSRAHEEADLMDRLAQTIGNQCTTTLEWMQKSCSRRSTKKSEKTSTEPKQRCEDEKLERLLKQILTGVNWLLQRPTSADRVLPPHSADKKSYQSLRKSRRRATFPPRSTNVDATDSEFEELIGLKHQLMVDALQITQSQMAPPKRTFSGCPRCKLIA